jgi:cell division protein FtsW (lipid II flippase)
MFQMFHVPKGKTHLEQAILKIVNHFFMKKQYGKLLFVLIIALTTFFFSTVSGNWWLGFVCGGAVAILISSVIGFYVMRIHISHLDKIEGDYLHEIQHSVEKSDYE